MEKKVNHPANYKGCTVYKELQRKTFPLLRQKIQTSDPTPNFIPNPHVQHGVTFAQITC